MPKKKKPRQMEEIWMPLKEAAEFFGMTTEGWRKSVRPLLSEGDVQKSSDGRVQICIAAAVEAYVAKRVAKAAAASQLDPLLAGGNSPALEEYRQHRATMALMDLQERQGTHCDIRKLSTPLQRFSSLIRGAGEALQRRFGNDAADLYNTGIDGAENAALEEMGEVQP